MRSKRVVGLAALLAAGVAACSERPEQLDLEGRTITVFNDSGEAWNGVEVWVNDHYRVTRPTIAPGEKFTVQVESFVAGFGQRFPANQMVNGIEVTATDESGDPIKLVRGTGRRR
jgi:hypothetical protein